jgi:hypothetical protein
VCLPNLGCLSSSQLAQSVVTHSRRDRCHCYAHSSTSFCPVFTRPQTAGEHIQESNLFPFDFHCSWTEGDSILSSAKDLFLAVLLQSGRQYTRVLLVLNDESMGCIALRLDRTQFHRRRHLPGYCCAHSWSTVLCGRYCLDIILQSQPSDNLTMDSQVGIFDRQWHHSIFELQRVR